MTQNTKAIDCKDEELSSLQTQLEESKGETQNMQQKLQELGDIVKEEKKKAKDALKQVSCRMRKHSLGLPYHSFANFVLFQLMLYVPVNSNGHVGMFLPFYETFTQR